jgi:hypothetical protein
MLSTNFIDVEIVRHCPNPTRRSQNMVNDIPLVLWQALLLAQDASFSSPYMIDNISRLVTTASSKLAKGGVTVAEGTLVRKVCGPLLARYSALCVSRRFSNADTQRDFIRSKAEDVFCVKFLGLLHHCRSHEERELIDPLGVRKLSEALYCSAAEELVAGRVADASQTRKVLQLGRTLFA